MKLIHHLIAIKNDDALRCKYVKIISNALMLFMMSTLILAIFVVFFRISGSDMKLGGFSMYRLISGSMAPKYKTGDYVIVRDTDASYLNTGDIIAYVSEESDTSGEVIVHRIVAIEEDTIVTRGDANPIDDKIKTTPTRVIGRVVMKLSLLKYADGIFSNAVMFVLFIVLPVVFMIFNESANLIFREKLRRRTRAIISGCGLDPDDEKLFEIAEKYGADAVSQIARKQKQETPRNENEGDKIV